MPEGPWGTTMTACISWMKQNRPKVKNPAALCQHIKQLQEKKNKALEDAELLNSIIDMILKELPTRGSGRDRGRSPDGRDGEPLSDEERRQRHEYIDSCMKKGKTREECVREWESEHQKEKAVSLNFNAELSRIIKAPDKFIIAGYAWPQLVDEEGRELPDPEGDDMNLKALDEAFTRMMSTPSRRNLMGWHSNIQIGELIEEAVDSDSVVWNAGVIFETSEQYPKKGLFVIAELFQDVNQSIRYIDAMKADHMLAFSISGEAIQTTKVCDDDICRNIVSVMDLHEVSSCEEGINPDASAFILKTKSDIDDEAAGKTLKSATMQAILEAMSVIKAKWTRAYINTLPNSSFAVVEPAYKRGETENKNARHLPYKGEGGKLDLPHLRNALARMNQIKPVTGSISASALRAAARRKLLPLARRHLPNSQWAQKSRDEAAQTLEKADNGVTLLKRLLKY